MRKGKNRTMIWVLGILGVAGLAVLAFLMDARADFTRHLAETYPEQTFSVGIPGIDPIYEKVYARAVCREDETAFSVSRGLTGEAVRDTYLGAKSQNAYNARIQGVFDGSVLGGAVKSATGSGKTLFWESEGFEQVNLYLAEDADQPAVLEKALGRMAEAGIRAELILATYERNGHVYEIRLSDGDYGLDAEAIEARIRQIK